VEFPTTRRRVLGLAAAGGLAAAAATTARPGPATAAGRTPEPVTHGPASLTAAMRGGTRVGDKLYQTTRYLPDGERLRVVEGDLTTGEVSWIGDLELPGMQSGGGGLMMASDGTHAYIGAAGNSDVFRLDPATKQVESLGPVGPESAWYYDMAVAGDWLYVSTYPDCTVRRVHLTTREVQTYGVVSESKYANSLAVGDSHVYGGANAPGGIREWALEPGGEGRDITDHLGEGHTIPIRMAVSAGLLYVATGDHVISFDPADGSDHVARLLPDERDRYIDYMCVASDGAVYAQARTSGHVYRCDPDALVKVGQACEDDGQNVYLGEWTPGVLCGAGSSGRFWRMTLGEPAEEFDILADAGYPDRAQHMIRHSDGTIWVSGHGVTTRHDLAAGTSEMSKNFGEIKALQETAGGIVYGAVYPGCTITRFDTATLEHTDVAALEGQYRPSLMAYDEPRNQLVIGSGPHIGGNQGALSFVDLADHAVEVRTDYLPDQVVRGIHVVGDTVYLAGDTHGEATGSVRPVAQVAAVDLRTRELLWRAEPRSDVESYEQVHLRGDKLYLMTRRPRGELITFRPDDGAVTRVTNLGGYGGMDGYGRRLLTWVHWALEIDHITVDDRVRTLYPEVPNGWYNNPTFVFDPDRDGTYGMYGLELAWFPFRA